MLNWIDRISLPQFAFLSIMLALMPAILPPFPEPHLVEKIRMLMEGTLHKPIDIFDLFMHATPISLLLIRLFRIWNGTATTESE